MPMTLASPHLGTMTWAALQAAYPHGGGALAALPRETTVAVTGASSHAVLTLTPNAAMTRWVPLNGSATICGFAGSLASPVFIWDGATGKASLPGGDVQIAAGVLGVGHRLVHSYLIRKRGTAATAACQVRLGTAGTTSDSSIFTETMTNVENRQIRHLQEITFGSTTAYMTTNWLGPVGQTTAAVVDRPGNIDTTAVMYLTPWVTSLDAADDIDLVYIALEWNAS